jgi:hypothetical protein
VRCFRVLAPLGEGAFGTVVLVQDPSGVLSACKVLDKRTVLLNGQVCVAQGKGLPLFDSKFYFPPILFSMRKVGAREE